MKPKVAVCLPGGGAAGAMFQIGALAALEDGLQAVDGQRFRAYIGSSSAATEAPLELPMYARKRWPSTAWRPSSSAASAPIW